MSLTTSPIDQNAADDRALADLDEPTTDALAALDEPTSDALAEDAAEAEKAFHAAPLIATDVAGEAGAMYMREISAHTLLTAADEVRLAQQLESGIAAHAQLAELKAKGDSDGEEFADLVKEVEALVAQGQRARATLVECNLRLVVSVARRYMNRGLGFLDLVQEGNIGLHIGVQKYDWRKGFRLSTYVYWWIRQAVSRAIADQGRTIRIPVHVAEMLGRAARAERDLLYELGRQPTLEEVAEAVGTTVNRLTTARRAAQQTLSLEAPSRGHDGDSDDRITRASSISDEIATAEASDAAEGWDMSTRLHAALTELTDYEQKVLKLRFGIDQDRGFTEEEVADELGISTNRVQSIESCALRRLRCDRRFSAFQGLREYAAG